MLKAQQSAKMAFFHLSQISVKFTNDSCGFYDHGKEDGARLRKLPAGERWSRCRWILYCLSHQGSPRILEQVAYPFSRGSSHPRNPTGVSCIAGMREVNKTMLIMNLERADRERGAVAQSPGREAALAWASLAQRFPASSVLARVSRSGGLL